jgi:MFS family permease
MEKVKSWYIVLMSAFAGCAITAAFPQASMTVTQMAGATGISEALLLTSDTVKSVGIILAMLVSGFLYNRFGARPLLLYALVSTCLPQFLLPHIHSVLSLFTLKILQGSCSLAFPVFLVIIMESFEGKNTGISMAIFNGLFYSGGGLGATFAGLIIPRMGWEASYYGLGIIQFVLCLICLLTIKGRGGRRAADSRKTQDGPSGWTLLASPKTWILAICLLTTTWSVQAITVDMPLFLRALGYGEANTGTILTAVTIGIIGACLISGKASDFFARRSGRKASARIAVLIFGPVATIAAIALMTLGNLSDFRMIYLCVLLFTFAAAWGLGAFYPVIPEMYRDEAVPIVTGTAGGIGDCGMPVAPLVVGVIFGLRGSWSVGWWSCGGMAVVSLLASLILLVSLKRNGVRDGAA